MYRQIFFGLIVLLTPLFFISISCDRDTPTESNTTLLTKVSGDSQSGAPGDTLSTPLRVLVTDSKGRAISGQWLDFSIIEGTASLSDTLVVTNEIGKAETKLILGDSEGEIRVEAKLRNTVIKTFFTASASNLPPVSIEIFSGNNQGGKPGLLLSDALQVSLKNERGQPAIGAIVIFNISEGAGKLSALSDTTNSLGIAETWLTLGTDTEIVRVIAVVSEIEISLELLAFSWEYLSTNKIAYWSDRERDDEIYVMNADGSNQRNITENSNSDYCPSWSPDGSMIAFHSSRDGNVDIYIMNTDGSNQTNISKNSDYDGHPSWSPDGTKIAFDSYRDGNYEIYVMYANGSNQTKLTEDGGESPSWSPDGSMIAFCSSRDGNSEIYIMNNDGSNQTRLTDNQASDIYPSWKPGGSMIGFFSSRDGNGEIYVMNNDGLNQTRLTDNQASDSYPSWSPDGTKIALQSNRSGKFQIYVMNADGSNQINLSNNSDNNYAPSWSPK